MVRLLRALSFAALAVVATAKPQPHTKFHVAKPQTAVASKAHSAIHRNVHSAISDKNGSDSHEAYIMDSDIQETPFNSDPSMLDVSDDDDRRVAGDDDDGSSDANDNDDSNDADDVNDSNDNDDSNDADDVNDSNDNDDSNDADDVNDASDNDDADDLDDSNDADDNGDASDDGTGLSVCTDKDLEVFAQFADDAKLAKFCGADNVAALKGLDFWSFNTCGSQECWDYVHESLETKVPTCIYETTVLTHYLTSRLKVCSAKEEETIVIPTCTDEADTVLAELSETLELESVCGAEIASNFTVDGLSSIKACDNEACRQLLTGAAASLPICLDGDVLLHNVLVHELSTCARDCSKDDYAALEAFADEPQFVKHCGARSVKAIKARFFADLDVCASPQCEALVYFALMESVIPVCRDHGQWLHLAISRTWSSCNLFN